MNTVTLILPKDTTKLEEMYAAAFANAISEILTFEELGFLIRELEKKDNKSY
jgi:hypothetical protein